MLLERVTKRKNRVKKAKRLGRGYGSGVGGHTVGRGTKGQKSRSGHKSTLFFEGGNVPFFRRVPKYKGFKRNIKVIYQPVNVSTLDKEFKIGEVVTLESLKSKGLIGKKISNVKVLGNGELSKKINIEGLLCSQAARKKIVDKGGSVK